MTYFVENNYKALLEKELVKLTEIKDGELERQRETDAKTENPEWKKARSELSETKYRLGYKGLKYGALLGITVSAIAIAIIGMGPVGIVSAAAAMGFKGISLGYILAGTATLGTVLGSTLGILTGRTAGSFSVKMPAAKTYKRSEADDKTLMENAESKAAAKMIGEIKENTKISSSDNAQTIIAKLLEREKQLKNICEIKDKDCYSLKEAAQKDLEEMKTPNSAIALIKKLGHRQDFFISPSDDAPAKIKKIDNQANLLTGFLTKADGDLFEPYQEAVKAHLDELGKQKTEIKKEESERQAEENKRKLELKNSGKSEDVKNAILRKMIGKKAAATLGI